MNDDIKEKLKMNIAISKIKKEGETMNKIKKNVLKNVGIAACITISMSGVVFAGTIMNKLYTSKSSIKTALDYNYVQNINMDYEEKNNVGIKIESIIMDDSNLAIVFSFKLPNKFKDINDLVFQNLIINDENNNVLFEDGNEKSLSTGYSKELSNENNEIKEALIIENFNHTNPRSSKIHISFSSISLIKKGKNKTITGNWNYDIDVIDKFVNREKISYKSSESENVKILKADLTSTGLDLEIQFNSPQNTELLINNMFIQDEMGKQYYIEGGINAINEDTKPIVKASFPITSFKVLENLKLIIKTEHEIIIDLVK